MVDESGTKTLRREGVRHMDFLRRTFHEEGAASAKALRHGCA